MRKLIGLLIVGLLIFGSVYAFEFKKENVLVGLEYTYTENEIDSLKPIAIDVLGIQAGLKSKIEDLKISQVLVSSGYKLSDYLIPYSLIGVSKLKFDERLIGNISSPFISGETDLAALSYEGDNEFTFGFGAKGKLIELPAGLIVSYDVRRISFEGSDSVDVRLLPSFIDLSAISDVDVEYAEWDLSLKLGKEFEIGKVIKSIAPYIGYKYSNIDMNVKSKTHIFIADLDLEKDISTDGHSMLVGLEAKINDNIVVAVGGSFFGEQGVTASVTYSF